MGGTPKSSMLIGFSIQKPSSYWVTPICHPLIHHVRACFQAPHFTSATLMCRTDCNKAAKPTCKSFGTGFFHIPGRRNQAQRDQSWSMPGTWTWYWHVEVKKQGAPNHFRGYKLPNMGLTSTNMAWWNIRWNTWVPLLIRDQDNMLLLPYRFAMSPYMLWWHGPKFRKNAEWESHWENIEKNICYKWLDYHLGSLYYSNILFASPPPPHCSCTEMFSHLCVKVTWALKAGYPQKSCLIITWAASFTGKIWALTDSNVHYSWWFLVISCYSWLLTDGWIPHVGCLSPHLASA